jgi:hypothetical protein
MPEATLPLEKALIVQGARRINQLTDGPYATLKPSHGTQDYSGGTVPAFHGIPF